MWFRRSEALRWTGLWLIAGLVGTLFMGVARPEQDTGLVRLLTLDPDFVLDIRYATAHNFTRQQIYPRAEALLVAPSARKLVAAQRYFKQRGYRIKIYDAYRPLSAQYRLWAVVPDARYVANPKTGSVHNRGCAVDLTLVDSTGTELRMPTPWDDFTPAAQADYQGPDSTIRRNVRLLQVGMTQAGFEIYPPEWWHFNDRDWRKFPILDVDF
jgi:D-alanyl-D-alanine dipeptidase